MTGVRNPTTGPRTRNYWRHDDLTSFQHVVHALERARRIDTTGSISPTYGLAVALLELAAAMWLADSFGRDLHPLLVAGYSLGVIAVAGAGMLTPETLIDTWRHRQHRDDPVGRLLAIIGGPAALPAVWLGQIAGGLTSWQRGHARIERWVQRELPTEEGRETLIALADEYDGTLGELVLTVKLLTAAGEHEPRPAGQH